ncbi:MAG: gliding motility-associated C-terminal domain-containing protein [Bacteroidia bacterium]|nr:gliding motility-associated C-terminal domain-containing protein [Bacteroidia bacterium]GIV22663.1 MAG: hypothetical protein KatS3mg025_0322 [Bacteroidia bacterium]
MRAKGGMIGFLALVWAQPQYVVEFVQGYTVSSTPSAPDSVDIYLILRQSSGGSPDTLASSNFPFLYNATLLNMVGARVIHMRKFSNQSRPNYYDAISWSYVVGRVNVTIRRRIGWANPGDIIASVDTIFGLRVPVYGCGPAYKSVLIWDSVPAAVLNSLLQDMKPRIDWSSPDTLSLCPSASFSSSLSGPTGTPCVGSGLTWTFSGASTDSFVVWVRQNPPTGPSAAYPGTVTCAGGSCSFTLSFGVADSYHVWVEAVDRKCSCPKGLSDTSRFRIYAPPPAYPILGPATVYGGGSYTYTAGGAAASASWTYTPQGGSAQNVGSGSSVSVSISPASSPRVDTLRATYPVGGPCGGVAEQLITVLPCPDGSYAKALSPGICRGQRAVVELQGYTPGWDSLRWQVWNGSAWVDIPDGVGIGATATVYISPPLTTGPAIFRARVHYMQCVDTSASDTVRVASDVIDRNFLSLTSPVCAGDTAWMVATGPGVWYTPDGQGTFTDTLDPEAGYISSPTDPSTVQICWVIRSQDLMRCRAPGTDTLCLTLTVLPTDAQGAFALPAGQDTVCTGGRTVPLNGQIISGTGGYWTSDGAGFFSPSERDPQASYVSAQADAGRWIHITWHVVGSCGEQRYTDSVYVELGTAATIQGPNQLCANVPLVLQAVPSTGFDSVLWFQGSLASVLAAGPLSSANPRFLTDSSIYEGGLRPVGQDTFLLYGRSGSCESFDQQVVEVLPAPTAAFDAIPRITNMNNPTVQFSSQSQGANVYVWNFGDPNNPVQDSVPNPTFTYSAPGTYTVVLFVQNAQGCSDFYVCTNCIQVLPRRVFLPNAFSPNGDGKNDVFRILPLEEGLRFTRLEVFDRWGQVVFAADNIAEWDGRGKNSQSLDPGAYSYRAIIVLPDEGVVTYTGVVHITR